MKSGYVVSVDMHDMGGLHAKVSVEFTVNRSILYEFIDCLMPVDEYALREPVEAILEHSRVEVKR